MSPIAVCFGQPRSGCPFFADTMTERVVFHLHRLVSEQPSYLMRSGMALIECQAVVAFKREGRKVLIYYCICYPPDAGGSCLEPVNAGQIFIAKLKHTRRLAKYLTN